MIKINLLPIEKRQKEKNAKQNLGLLLIVIGIFIILLLIIIVLLALDSTLKTQISAKDTEISSTKTSLSAYKDTQDKVIFIKDRLSAISQVPDSKRDWSKILNTLATNCPASVTLSSFQTNTATKPNVKIMGFAASRLEAAKFRQSLEDSKAFTDVVLESSKKTTEDNKELVDFTITANLK
jgi:Tfp pilus assembly protein PilN